MGTPAAVRYLIGHSLRVPPHVKEKEAITAKIIPVNGKAVIRRVYLA